MVCVQAGVQVPRLLTGDEPLVGLQTRTLGPSTPTNGRFLKCGWGCGARCGACAHTSRRQVRHVCGSLHQIRWVGGMGPHAHLLALFVGGQGGFCC